MLNKPSKYKSLFTTKNLVAISISTTSTTTTATPQGV